jgi:hypothetical protein
VKSIAILVGYGPDVDFVLQNRGLVPDAVELFRLNVRGLGQDQDEHGLPLLNPFTWDVTITILNEHRLSQLATFGSLAFRVADATHLLKGPGAYRLWQILPHVANRATSSDAGRAFIFSKLQDQFALPRLIDVLPLLFAQEDIAINPNDEQLGRALKDVRSYQKDALLNLDGGPVKIFRVPKSPPRNLFNRRLDPAKMARIHQEQKARYFFFDREQTTVVGLEKMKDYARANGLTFQSFVDVR